MKTEGSVKKMIEILFGTYEGLSMMEAKNYEAPDFRHCASSIRYIGRFPKFRAIGYIGRFLIFRRRHRVAELEKEFEGKPVGGNRDDVVYIDMNLDIGDISIPIDIEYRKKLFFDLCSGYGRDDVDMEDWNGEWNQRLTQISRLDKFINQGEDFRIWYSNTPYSLCGLYYVCYRLRNCGCKVTTIKLPESQEESKSQLPKGTTWGQIDAGKMYRFLPLEKQLTHDEIQNNAHKWVALTSEKSDLRVIADGMLKGASSDYYDSIIRKEMPDGEFRLGFLIGTILENYPQGITDGWYAGRVIKMIEDGELKIVKNDENRTYAMVVRKKK